MNQVEYFVEKIGKDLVDNRSIWASFLTDDEINSIPNATKWAAKMMLSDWQNCFKVYWRDASVQGEQLTSFCPRFPDNSIMHTGDIRGDTNVMHTGDIRGDTNETSLNIS